MLAGWSSAPIIGLTSRDSKQSSASRPEPVRRDAAVHAIDHGVQGVAAMLSVFLGEGEARER